MNESEKLDCGANQKNITLAITGASGAIYGVSLLKKLVMFYDCVFLLVSDAGRMVLATELNIKLAESPSKIENKLVEECECDPGKIKVFAKENWLSPVASGSAAPKQMVVCPASMGCISAIANGASNNLMERAADVVIKEKGQLILLPREMPFSSIHLKNLLQLAEAGVTIMPACPGFYDKPQTVHNLVDFVVARILDHLGIENNLVRNWGYK